MERAAQVEAAAASAAAAAAEETMALFDACWFHRCVLLPSPSPALMHSSSPPAERLVDVERPQQFVVPSSSNPAAATGLRHRRTRSDEATTTAASAFQQGLEPLRIPNARARLETILSGKDGIVVAAPQPLPERKPRPEARSRRPRTRRHQRRGRSMSELEFEELKGLQDLGFTFADAEVDAELASIVPGLRRKLSEGVESLATASAPAVAVPSSSSSSSSAQDEEEPAFDAARRRRPYLSEAWEDDDNDEEEQVRAALSNWRIPPAVDGADLKEHLRMWAHTVASAVR